MGNGMRPAGFLYARARTRDLVCAHIVRAWLGMAGAIGAASVIYASQYVHTHGRHALSNGERLCGGSTHIVTFRHCAEGVLTLQLDRAEMTTHASRSVTLSRMLRRPGRMAANKVVV